MHKNVQTKTRPSDGKTTETREPSPYPRRMIDVINHIYAADDIDKLFLTIAGEILSLFEAEHLTIYAVDYDDNDLFSRYWDNKRLGEINEIRVNIDDKSIAGHVALHRRPLNILDVWDDKELAKLEPTPAFDKSWDEKTGVRTKQMLVMPVLGPEDNLMGVIQLINRTNGDRFTPRDEEMLLEICRPLGMALYNHTPKRTRFDLLLADKTISHDDLLEAKAEARKQDASVESILLQQFKVPKELIGKSLSSFFGHPFQAFDEARLIVPTAVKGVRPDYMRMHYWVPLKVEKDAVEVLTE